MAKELALDAAAKDLVAPDVVARDLVAPDAVAKDLVAPVARDLVAPEVAKDLVAPEVAADLVAPPADRVKGPKGPSGLDPLPSNVCRRGVRLL